MQCYGGEEEEGKDIPDCLSTSSMHPDQSHSNDIQMSPSSHHLSFSTQVQYSRREAKLRLSALTIVASTVGLSDLGDDDGWTKSQSTRLVSPSRRARSWT